MMQTSPIVVVVVVNAMTTNRNSRLLMNEIVMISHTELVELIESKSMNVLSLVVCDTFA